MFCRKSGQKLEDKVARIMKLKEKSNVSNFERAQKPAQKLTLEELKALAK